MKISIASINEITEAAKEFLNAFPHQKHFAFYGEMGVGKTTFIKALCKQLDAIEVVTSPTFAIVNEYHTRSGETIYHFDFYRINKLEELYDLGYENYLYSPHYCFIEWPEKGQEVLPEHIQKINISEKPDGTRIIDFLS
jgi:tRNA threonylcarbamoyladenosine biosynthesis protein TsaE